MEIHPRRAHTLGPRIPMHHERNVPSTTLGMKAPSRILRRGPTETCTDANLCEKPISQKDLALPISLGVMCVTTSSITNLEAHVLT